MGELGSTWCADAVLHCAANARPTLAHSLSCKHKDGINAQNCIGCVVQQILSERASNPHQAKTSDKDQLLKLVSVVGFGRQSCAFEVTHK